ncbi:MAG: MATE family efflux transporter [Dehalococcoidales bacterium]|nr:MATE family efflux transporter [Dehalococcoidales bacterium]
MRRAAIERDWTQGSIVGNLWSLSWPIMISQMLNMLGPTIDMIWVGRLGSDALAAVGVSGMAVNVANSLIMGVFTSVRAMVARFIGAGDRESANHITQQAFVLGAVISAVIAVIGIFFSEQILAWLGVSEGVISTGAAYMRIQFIGIVTMSIRMITESAMQASGDSVNPMRIAVIFRIIHLGLCPALIFGFWLFPAMGVEGAAWTNVITQTLGGFMGLWFLVTGRTRMKLTFRNFRFDPAVIWRMVKIGLPAAITGIERSFANILLVKFISPFGTVAVAAQSLEERIGQFIQMPAMGFGMAGGVMAGQNLGAGKPERAEKSGWIAAFCFTGIMVVGCLVIWFFSDYIVRIFNSEPELVAVTSNFLKIQIISYLVFGFVLVLSQTLNGVGDTVVPMLVTLTTMWLVQVPMAYVLSKTTLGMYGVRWGIVLAIFLRAIIYIVYYRTGRWKHKKV